MIIMTIFGVLYNYKNEDDSYDNIASYVIYFTFLLIYFTDIILIRYLYCRFLI